MPSPSSWRLRLLTVAGSALAVIALPAAELLSQAPGTNDAASEPTLADAQYQFYSGRYEPAAATALAVRPSAPDDLATYELRTSALHFQIRRALEAQPAKGRTLARCAACARLMADFLSDTARGQSLAHAALKANPHDETTLFYLGKLDLNYVWLQLGTLGRKTGWGEYWEARHSLDAVLQRNPANIRARVARAWIDYIVDTRMPLGTRWMLGGGNKKGALAAVRAAADADADLFTRAEARFALWDMQVREKRIADAVVTAKVLARDFPDNEELSRFLEKHDRETETK